MGESIWNVDSLKALFDERTLRFDGERDAAKEAVRVAQEAAKEAVVLAKAAADEAKGKITIAQLASGVAILLALASFLK